MKHIVVVESPQAGHVVWGAPESLWLTAHSLQVLVSQAAHPHELTKTKVPEIMFSLPKITMDRGD